MTSTRDNRPTNLTEQMIDRICDRVRAGKRVRRRLPGWGRVHIDRPLPFLCIYRKVPGDPAPGVDKIVASEASYILASVARSQNRQVQSLVDRLVAVITEQFETCLIVEMWPGPQAGTCVEVPSEPQAPAFTVYHPRRLAEDPTLDKLSSALKQVRLAGRETSVRMVVSARWGRPGLPLLLGRGQTERMAHHSVGIEIGPCWSAQAESEDFPLVLRSIRRKLTLALRKTFYEFAKEHATRHPKHYHMLGRRAVVKAVWEVDRRLADVSDTFDFLLQVTPTNVERCWRGFERSGCERVGKFRYRPLPLEPAILKRSLYSAPIERVEDPTLAGLFRQKQDELDRQITMLTDLNTPRFVQGSLQLYGPVDDRLYQTALQLLEFIPGRSRENPKGGVLDAEGFARRAKQELAMYDAIPANAGLDVQIRTDLHAGLMVSGGTLLIGHRLRVPLSRAEALIQHEVGTHLLTYANGRAQPFQQLHTGLAGYESLQEGLAVLAEYLVGGLSHPRLRLLAARVVAVHCLLDGATFTETYRQLHSHFHFDRKAAYTVTMRVFRAGGLTKDAVYLAGLCQVLRYLSEGNELSPLFVGKIGVEHIGLIRELQWRRVLVDAPLIPRYMTCPNAVERLSVLTRGVNVMDLAEG